MHEKKPEQANHPVIQKDRESGERERERGGENRHSTMTYREGEGKKQGKTVTRVDG
jgi:hypothetical protein